MSQCVNRSSHFKNRFLWFILKTAFETAVVFEAPCDRPTAGRDVMVGK